MSLAPLFRAASALLALALASGVGMIFVRFGSDRPSPPWLAKLHGLAAAGAITLLAFGWAQAPAFPDAAVVGLAVLAAGALGGLVLNLAYHWPGRPLPEWLVFAHLAVASLGFLLVGVVTLSLAA